MIELWGLFIASFAAATLLPGGSEVILVGLYLKGNEPTVSLWLVATLGNTLGAVVTVWMGRVVARSRPPKPKHAWQLRWHLRLQKHGSPILLMSWLPLVGDGLCLLAGWLRLNWRGVLLFITLGKALRYLLVLLLATPWG
ncbi:YqaA family protein [Corallincola spongiicola]|uniref:DedA family protein n=1 Tax=Corallincola spongiicola TaxID=2520508 RepID=A0ABY1WRM7_9GAMM|nr:VTT domain-containing protein [Corallincola spongiicola]TAA47380.1 DedA family protein [Corallincola spongiicola]